MRYTDQIIDPHHHLWNLDLNYYPWLTDTVRDIWIGDYSAIRRNYLVTDYMADIARQNVVKSVHIQALSDSGNPVGEIKWLQKTADKYGYPHGIVAYVDLSDPNVEDILKAHCQYSNIRGVRMILSWHENEMYRLAARPDYMTDPDWLKGFSLLEKHNLSFDLQIYEHQMKDAAALARRFPSTQIILNHTGMPIGKNPEDVKNWRKNMAILAEQKNVAVKISGLGMLDHTWTIGSIKAFVRDTIDIFGVSYCMFASNFPVDKLYSSYNVLFDAYKTIVSDFPNEDLKKLFYDNAKKYYRLP